MLFGRAAEQASIAELLTSVRLGHSGVLVLRGDAGIGKSALLEASLAHAEGMTVLSARGTESEACLPYASLHQLLRPVLHDIDQLPERQAEALRGALGLDSGRNDEWFLVSLAVLNLLAEVAERGPLLCLLDDAHWLDDASAESLVFAARRLEAEPVALLFAARDDESRTFDAPGLPELRLAGLDAAAAGELLDHTGVSLPGRDRQHIIERAGGNPLALLELSSGASDAQLEGLAPLPISSRIERTFRAQLDQLPDPTRTLLLVAAADDRGSLTTVSAAGARLGIDASALDDAERAGLVRIEDSVVRFRHPLVRSAVYQGSRFSQRRAAHQALADVLTREADADRRAWHRAVASIEVDQSVADDLEEAGWRAYRRSGFVPASLAFERAAELSPESRHAVRLLSQAVDSAWFAGRLPRALVLLDRAWTLTDNPVDRAEINRWRGLIEMSAGHPLRARDLLIEAAGHLPPTHPGRALHLLGLACIASAYGGDGARVPAMAEAVDTLTDDRTPLARFLTRFVRGTGAYFAADYPSAARELRSAVELAAEAETADSPHVPGWRLLIGACFLFLGDDFAAHQANDSLVRAARQAGAVPLVNEVLPRLAISQVALGRWADAAADLAEGLQLATDIGQDQVLGHILSMSALVAGLRGDEAECRALAARGLELATTRGLVHVAHTAHWALLGLELGQGRPSEAFTHARAIHQVPIAHWCAPERIEAAARAGHEETARTWLAEFDAWAAAGDQAWARAAQLRCRAMITAGAEPRETLLREAVDAAGTAVRPLETARAELALGEHLRRAGQRVDARTHLREALERFESLGASSWAERARAELRASGQTVPTRASDAESRLTRQEQQIARYVAQGLTNREIAAQLFLSPRTVDFHLRKIFTKLGITSRVQLARLELDRRQ